MVINGNKIRELRQSSNMHLTDLAVVAGVSYPTISYIETEKKTCTVEVLSRIAAHFGVKVDDLLRKPQEVQGSGVYNELCVKPKRD